MTNEPQTTNTAEVLANADRGPSLQRRPDMDKPNRLAWEMPNGGILWSNDPPEIIAPPMSDAAMLDTLSEWFDAQRPDDPYREVQVDLLRIAARLRALDGK